MTWQAILRGLTGAPAGASHPPKEPDGSVRWKEIRPLGCACMLKEWRGPRKLAKVAEQAGLDIPNLSNYERGIRVPGPADRRRLMSFYRAAEAELAEALVTPWHGRRRRVA